jgi:hypothetical protein|nr:hypothetical protein [uncultured Acetatifactor sp.]
MDKLIKNMDYFLAEIEDENKIILRNDSEEKNYILNITTGFIWNKSNGITVEELWRLYKEQFQLDKSNILDQAWEDFNKVLDVMIREELIFVDRTN